MVSGSCIDGHEDLARQCVWLLLEPEAEGSPPQKLLGWMEPGRSTCGATPTCLPRARSPARLITRDRLRGGLGEVGWLIPVCFFVGRRRRSYHGQVGPQVTMYARPGEAFAYVDGARTKQVVLVYPLSITSFWVSSLLIIIIAERPARTTSKYSLSASRARPPGAARVAAALLSENDDTAGNDEPGSPSLEERCTASSRTEAETGT
jgi:hypothetical protein